MQDITFKKNKTVSKSLSRRNSSTKTGFEVGIKTEIEAKNSIENVIILKKNFSFAHKKLTNKYLLFFTTLLIKDVIVAAFRALEFTKVILFYVSVYIHQKKYDHFFFFFFYDKD